MPFNYTLNLSEHQILFLLWVENKCPDDTPLGITIHAQSQFLRIMRKLIQHNFIEHNPEKPNWRLTEKGETLMWLLRLEREDIEKGK